MVKRGILALIMILAILDAAFTQTRFDVQWRGYEISPQNSVFINDNITLNNNFVNKLRDLDTDNGYLNIVSTYYVTSNISPSDYIIRGTITQYKDDMYNINTLLLVQKGGQSYPVDSSREYVHLNTLKEIISEHAEEIYKRFKYFVDIEKNRDLQQLLVDFDKEYMQNISAMNIEVSNHALQRLAILENNFGKSETISRRRYEIVYSAIAVSLSKAEENIDRAFDRRVSNDASASFCKTAEIYVLQIRQLIEQSEDPTLLARLKDVERKIDKYWKESYFAVYTGGLELFIEKPYLMPLTSSAGIDLQKAYPDILGVNLRYNGPASLPIQWYVHLSYAGINGGIKENNVAYLKDAAIHYFSLSTGMNLQFYVNRIIAPYGYYGLGYMHLFEYASDGKESITLNFPGMIMDVGAGSRFHFNQHFALNAMVQWNLMVTEAMLMDVKFSLGISYMFYNKEYIIRR